MTDTEWEGERFEQELTESLVQVVACSRTPVGLGQAVFESAAAAERFCLEQPVACAAGCSHCCVLSVAILLPEGMLIADWLRGRLSPEVLGSVVERLRSHASWGRWMDDEERIVRRVVCPFLDTAGLCTIYPVRPLVCRAVVSLDRSCCLKAFDPVITDEVREVPTDLLRKSAFDAAFTALARALRHHSIDDRSIELGVGVLAFLEHPEQRKHLLEQRRLPDALWR